MSNQGMDQEKRLRREIANSNERRRMQSINSGFQSLRSLLPHTDGEKLSKAAILQHAADLIQQIEQEKARLFEQNLHFKRVLTSIKNGAPATVALQTLTEEELVETAPTLYVPTVKKFRSNSATSASSISSHAVSPGIVTSSAVATTTTTTTAATATQQKVKVEITNDSSSNTNNNNNNNSTTTTTTSNSGSSTTAAASSDAATTTTSNSGSRTTDAADATTTTITTNSESLPGKAAIALPLDVSFITENVIVIEQGEKPQQAASRQNLDSIFEAIKHLEGEGLFKA